MLGIHRILVPIDFSEASKEAFRCAAIWAEKFGASIAILHACETPTLFGPPEVPVLVTDAVLAEEGRTLDDARVQLRRFLHEVSSNEEDPGVTILARSGEPSKIILDTARDGGFDLIVLGTHGRTGLSHMLLGSVAERVLRRATCPVMTVRAPHADRAAA
jgi:universal stress protein A